MAKVTTRREVRSMERKIVRISPKRQITIPQAFFTRLGFDEEAECVVRGNELVLRPASRHGSGEFAQEILQDLVAQGLSGQALLDAFQAAQAQVRPAVEKMLAQAEQAAAGTGEYATYEDLFGPEEEA